MKTSGVYEGWSWILRAGAYEYATRSLSARMAFSSCEKMPTEVCAQSLQLDRVQLGRTSAHADMIARCPESEMDLQ